MGSSTQKQTQQSSATTNPWGPTQDALQGAIPEIQGQYQQDKGGTLVPQASSYLSGVIGGNYLDPSTNPNLGALTKAVTDPIQASLSAQFSRAGRGNSGDAAQYIAQGMTTGLAAPLFNQYNQERGFQQQAAAAAPAMDAAGSQALDQYLQRLQGLGAAFPESSGTSTGTTKTTPSLGQNIMGAGLMGLGLSSAFGLGSPAGLLGYGGGRGSGSLLGLLRYSNPFGLDVGLNSWGSGTSILPYQQ